MKPYLIKDFGDGVQRSILIPKNEKKQLLNEINAFGINHAFLFPELEHQAMHIRHKYEDG